MASAIPRGSTDRRYTYPSFDAHYAETHSSSNLTSHAVRTPFPRVVRIFDVHLHNPPRIHSMMPSFCDSFFIKVSVDGRPYPSITTEKYRSSFQLKTELELTIQASSKISFEVFATRFTCPHDSIGKVEENVETLLDHHSRTLLVPGTSTKMEFKIMHNVIEHGSIPLNPLIHSQTLPLVHHQPWF